MSVTGVGESTGDTTTVLAGGAVFFLNLAEAATVVLATASEKVLADEKTLCLAFSLLVGLDAGEATDSLMGVMAGVKTSAEETLGFQRSSVVRGNQISCKLENRETLLNRGRAKAAAVMGIYKRLFTPLVNNVWSSLVSSSGRVGEPWTIFSRGLAAKPFREGGLQQQLNVNVQFEPVVNCGNVVNRQALPSFMGPKAYFAGFLNVHGNSSVQACSYHVRCYSSTGKVALMDKRNIQDHKRRLLAAKYEIKRVLYKAALRDPNLPRDLWEISHVSYLFS
ncbi:hypothetical protein SUGI_0976470 [Cryptomeria japonica]|nr:hypothetical protein SUGI_0976470 [Cryptomeria japonica]